MSIASVKQAAGEYDLFTARRGSMLGGSSEQPRSGRIAEIEPDSRSGRLLAGLHARTHARHRVIGDLSLPPDQMAEPVVLRRALAFAMVLRQMPVFIQDDELLVGGRTMYGPPRERPSEVFPGLVGVPSIGYFPTYVTAKEEAGAGMPGGAASNHNAIGYQKMLALGIGGIRTQAAQRRAEMAANPDGLDRPETKRRMAFLRAVDICLAALTDFIQRYSALARQLAAGVADSNRRSELADIAATCDAIANRAPTTFRAALQLYLFTRVASMVESYGCMPLGRFDQHLWPILEADLTAGRIDRTGALDLIESLFIKFNEEIDLSSTDDCQRIMLSGQTPDGQDATNELSLICLDASVRLRLPSPKIGVRLHKQTPPEFFRRVVETVQLGIAGLPEIYNDESVIPGLLRFGFPLRDALDYCHDGCSEITIGGKCDFYPTWSSVRHLRVLAGTLAGVPSDISWADLLAAYKQALVLAIRAAVERGNLRDRGLAAISPAPFMSSTLEGCVEQGLDKTWGGTIYNMTGLLGSELVNAANALAAIRQVLYQDGDISLDQLRAVLASNFEGLEGERLRLRLRNSCPKFGNDDARVDDLAAEIAQLFIEEGQSHANPRGGRFFPGFFDFAGYVTQVRSLGATPDGRRAGDSVSGHLAPVGGTDRNGVTANIQSMSRVTRLHPPMGTMFDVKLHPSAVRGSTGAEKLGGLIRAFMDLDGKALQFNVVDAATLRAAQANPEAHSDLLVRVWGFSAYFVELSQDFQEHIINRTEHGM